MELFRIIKRALLLIRDEVKQSLKDSKGYTDTKVAAEAKRTDNAMTEEQTRVNDEFTRVNDKFTRVNDELSKKVTWYDYYYQTTDINIGEKVNLIDIDYYEWNILRHVYTKGIALKTHYSGSFSFTTIDGETITVPKNTFYYNETSPLANTTSKYIKAIYNLEFDPSVTRFAISNPVASNVAFISSSSINADTEIESVAGFFSYCKNLYFIDFEIPKNAASHASCFRDCAKLRHTSVSIDWPNTTDASYAFLNNTYFGQGTDPLTGEQLIAKVKLPVADMVNYMLASSGVVHVSEVNAPLSSNATGLFENCKKLETVGDVILTSARYQDNLFRYCESLISINSISSKVGDSHFESYVSSQKMFFYCRKLESIPELTGVRGSLLYFATFCYELQTVPLMQIGDGSGTNKYSHSDAFDYCQKLANIGGFKFLYTSISFKHSPLLTRESCLNIFNYAAKVTTSPTITLHAEAYARLSEEDIAIAVNKGWTVASA